MTAVSGVPPGGIGRWVLCWSGIALMLCSVLSSDVTGEELVLFGAGSLREVMTQVATDYQTAYSVTVRTEFRPSGLIRGRLEKGERIDLFASAGMGHPLQLRQPSPCSRATPCVP